MLPSSLEDGNIQQLYVEFVGRKDDDKNITVPGLFPHNLKPPETPTATAE